MSIQHMQMVFDAGDLSGSEKAVLLAYCNHTDAHGYTWAGVKRVADMTGFSEKTVKNVRKALKERNLLRSSVRVERSGRRKTDITRINLTKLASLKLPPREYDDNVIAELEFEDEDLPDTTTDQPKGTRCPGADQPKGNSDPSQGKQVPLQEGEAVTPYPSEEPSSDPSSSSVTAEDKAPLAAPSETKKKSSDREEAERIIGERLPDTTPDERSAIVDVILAEAAAKGRKIGFLATYTRRRPDVLLEQDLNQVRRHSAAPTVAECGIHGVEMKPYGCDACAGEIKAGDPDDIARLRAHLAMVGEKARPDLARLLGAPQAAPAPRAGGGDVIDWRRIQKKRSDVVGGSRNPVADHAFYSQHTDDELKARFLG